MRPDTLWARSYVGPLGKAWGQSGQQTTDGGYIIAGYTYYDMSTTDVYLIKTDALGYVIWSKTYGTPGPNNEEWLMSICQLSDGGYIAVGCIISYDVGHWDIWLMRFDANGDTIWTKTYGGVHREYGYSVQPTSDGGYIIAGSTNSYGAGDYDVYLIKTDSIGNMQWSQTYGLASRDETGFSVRQTSDGGYIIVGGVDGFNPDVYAVKTYASGDTIWTKTYGGPFAVDCGFSVQQTTDGGYIIAGDTQSFTPSYFDVYLIKTDQDGIETWSKHYGGDQNDEGHAVCQTTDGGYIVSGYTTINGSRDVYLLKTNSNGDTCWTKTWGGAQNDVGYAVQQTADLGYAIVGINLPDVNRSNALLIRFTPDSLLTDDQAGLAYNGNRHLARQENSPNLNLVYSFENYVLYTKSTDAGANWNALENVGAGIYPAVALGPNNAPAVAWTNSDGYLYFAKKSGGSWLTTLLYEPPEPYGPLVNSPPAMIIKVGDEGLPSIVNILVTFTGQGAEPVTHIVRHYYFDFNTPSATFTTVETAVAPITPLRRHSPTLVRNEIDNSLHAAWMRVDTICYARKAVIGPWVKYGNPFTLPHGTLSAYPFIESYGDSIYLVWQEKATPTDPEEIWRGRRHRNQPPIRWGWWNHSRTLTTVSLFSANASGLFTVFMDQEESQMTFDVFYKIYQDDPLTNISLTTTESYYPQAAAWFTMIGNHLYTAWLEGNSIPYEIRLKDTFLPYNTGNEIAFLSSFSGDSIMSPYLSSRDGYKPDWQIPVDYGNQQLTYRFPLDPAYLYKAKIIAYHEKTNQWRALCKIDGGNQMTIKYSPHIPETLTFWIPPQLYQDSMLEVTLTKAAGDFVSMGQIYVYRYEQEYGGNGGPQSMSSIQTNNDQPQISIRPNPISDDFTISYTIACKADVDLKIFDAVGRVITIINQGIQMPGSYRKSIPSLDLPQGVYFIRLVAGDATVVEKVVFLR